MNLAGMTRYGTDEVVDAVVVGTGAGGAPLLARLAQAGPQGRGAGSGAQLGTERPTRPMRSRPLSSTG